MLRLSVSVLNLLSITFTWKYFIFTPLHLFNSLTCLLLERLHAASASSSAFLFIYDLILIKLVGNCFYLLISIDSLIFKNIDSDHQKIKNQ